MRKEKRKEKKEKEKKERIAWQYPSIAKKTPMPTTLMVQLKKLREYTIYNFCWISLSLLQHSNHRIIEVDDRPKRLNL